MTNVPIQSLIDHIKTAIDVDPWAKEMAEELLKEQEPADPIEMIDDFYPIGDPLRTIGWRCGRCGARIDGYENYCPECGKAVKWDETD